MLAGCEVCLHTRITSLHPKLPRKFTPMGKNKTFVPKVYTRYLLLFSKLKNVSVCMDANTPRSNHTCAQISSRISVWTLHARTLDSLVLLSLLSMQQQCRSTSRWSHFCGEYGWSHARMMADGGCMHWYGVLQMWLRNCFVTLCLILKRKKKHDTGHSTSREADQSSSGDAMHAFVNAIFVSESLGALSGVWRSPLNPHCMHEWTWLGDVRVLLLFLCKTVRMHCCGNSPGCMQDRMCLFVLRERQSFIESSQSCKCFGAGAIFEETAMM